MRGQRGLVSIWLLFLVVLLTVILQGFIQLLKQTVETQVSSIRYRQIAVLGTDLMAALTKEDIDSLSSFTAEPVKLYPGELQVSPVVNILRRSTGQLSVLDVSISYDDSVWSMRKLYIDPPGGSSHALYDNFRFAGRGLTGTIPDGLLPEGYPLNTIVPRLDPSGYAQYRSTTLPNMSVFDTFGLMDKLYVNTSTTTSTAYVVGANTIISGNGILYNDKSITITAGTKATGRLWLFSNNKINIGNNVNLSSALLFATGGITIGTNVTINGIVISAGTVTIGEGFQMTEDKNVLARFTTCSYLQ